MTVDTVYNFTVYDLIRLVTEHCTFIGFNVEVSSKQPLMEDQDECNIFIAIKDDTFLSVSTLAPIGPLVVFRKDYLDLLIKNHLKSRGVERAITISRSGGFVQAVVPEK